MPVFKGQELKYARKTAANEETINTGRCFLKGVLIAKQGTNNTVTIKDNTTTIVAFIVASSLIPNYVPLNINIKTSLKITHSAADGDMLYIYNA